MPPHLGNIGPSKFGVTIRLHPRCHAWQLPCPVYLVLETSGLIRFWGILGVAWKVLGGSRALGRVDKFSGTHGFGEMSSKNVPYLWIQFLPILESPAQVSSAVFEGWGRQVVYATSTDGLEQPMPGLDVQQEVWTCATPTGAPPILEPILVGMGMFAKVRDFDPWPYNCGWRHMGGLVIRIRSRCSIWERHGGTRAGGF